MRDAVHAGLGMVYGAILVKAYGFRIRKVLASAAVLVLLAWFWLENIQPAIDRWVNR